MDSKNANTRRKLKHIARVEEFENILKQTMLSDEDKTILRMYYIEEKQMSYIADMLGLPEATVKKKHRKALLKIGELF